VLRREALKGLIAMPFGRQRQGFNNPGLIIARIVRIFGPKSGWFIYDPVPGPGNLKDSGAAQAGTDQYGNAYQKDIVSYQSATTYAQLTNGGLVLKQAGSPTFPPDVTGNGTDLILNSGSDGTDGSQLAISEATGVLIQTQSGAPPSPLLDVEGKIFANGII